MKLKNDCIAFFKSTLNGKIKESNKSKSTLANPHAKCVTSNPVHRDIFNGTFQHRLLAEELLVSDTNNIKYQVSNFHRLCKIFDPNILIKMKPDGDVLLVCPWLYMNTFC